MGLSMLLVLATITQDPIDAIGSFAMKVAQQLLSVSSSAILSHLRELMVDGPSEIGNRPAQNIVFA
jgi:hypothetical protein